MNVKAERIGGRGPTHEVAICATGDSPQSMETANARLIAACSPANVAAILAHVKAQEAEIERLTAERDEARAERDALANVLPGVYYMDPPDGGDVSLLKQLQRMSNDAARYRLLRRKFAIISDGEGNAEFCPINLPRPTYIAPNTAIELDTALDRERLGLDGAKRPPTPVGWSDTDWTKHLQEQAEQPHPLAGQHINQDSMDAARYRFLSCKGVPPHSHRWSRWRLEYWNGEWWGPLMKEELDAAIDAQIEQERRDD